MTEHNNQDTLKPCPFCEGKPEIREDFMWTIVCTDCGASCDDYLPAERHKAVAAWNRRTPLNEQSQERDKQEPVGYQARIVTESGGFTGWWFSHPHEIKRFEGRDDIETRALYAAPLDAQAIRRKALEDCLVQIGMTAAYTEDDGNSGKLYDEIDRRIQSLIDKTGSA